MSAAETKDNPQPPEVRQNILRIATFVMRQTVDMQLDPDPAKLKSLININCKHRGGTGRARLIGPVSGSAAPSRFGS